MARPSGKCFGTVKDFDNIFVTNVPKPVFYDKTYGQVFRKKRRTGAGKHEGRGQSLDET